MTSSSKSINKKILALTQDEGFTLTLQETQSIHDSMNIPKNEFIAYIYIEL